MKSCIRYLLLTIAISLIFFYFGCQQEDEPVSIQERINMFLDDLNNDLEREDIWENLHPDIADPWKLPGTWGVPVATMPFAPLYVTFSFPGGLTIVGTNADGTLDSDPSTWDGEEIHIEFQEDETDVWYIKKIIVDTDNSTFSQFTLQ